MKRKIFTVLLAVVLVCSFSLVTAVPAAAQDGVPDRDTAIAKTADRLVALQDTTDGGWDWIVTDLIEHSAEPSAWNLYGVTALGLIDAYQVTENEAYKTAAQLTADYLLTVDRSVDSSARIFSFDYRFLVESSALFVDPLYKAHAISQWDWVKANSATLYADGNQAAFYAWYITIVSPGYAAWQTADTGLAALAMDDTSWASNMAAELVLHLGEILPGDEWRVIGWTKTLELLNEVDSVAYSTEIGDLITNLTDSQNEDGSWPGTTDQGAVQNTAYAVIGLAAVGDEGDADRRGADWLVTNQINTGDSIGGWIETDSEEYSENDSEALQALAATAAPVTIGDDLGYYSIQSAINSAALAGDTINVAAGTYAEVVTINKSLTLLGAKVGEDARTRDTSSGESILDGADVVLDVGEGAFNIADGISNVIIDGFEVCNYSGSSNPGNGTAFMAYCYGTQTEGRSNITIQNNYLHDLGWNGILVWSNNQVVQRGFIIQFNLIEGAPYGGIELTNATNSQVLSNKIIAPTVLAPDPGDAGVGIEIAVRAQPGFTIIAGTDVLVEGNEISGTFAEDSRAAINILSRTYDSSSTAELTGVTLRGNTISASVDVAILAMADESREGTATISNLQIVDDNKITGFTKGGIVVRDVLSVQIEGNIISTTDHSVAPNGIDIGATTGPTGTVKGNQVSGCHYGLYNPAEQTYEDEWTGAGILVIAPDSELEISGNEVQSCDVALDIEAGPLTFMENNDVHGNSYGFVLWNAAPAINFNNIYDNALGGVYLAADGDFEGALDATNNWWGNASGPDGAQDFTGPQTYTGVLPGSGDNVSANVECMPWLTRPFEKVIEDDIAYFGISSPALKGWNIVSAPLALDENVSVTVGGVEYKANTWGGLQYLGKIAEGDKYALKLHYTVPVDTRVYSPIWYYDSGPDSPDVGWRQATELTEINPVDAFYIRMMESDSIPILFSPDRSVPSKKLYKGWNLVGCAYMDVMFGEEEGLALETALATIESVSSPTGDVTGYDQVVSPSMNQPSWTFIPGPAGGTYIPSSVKGDTILIGKGYWVFMENPGTLAGLTFTPISLPK